MVDITADVCVVLDRENNCSNWHDERKNERTNERVSRRKEEIEYLSLENSILDVSIVLVVFLSSQLEKVCSFDNISNQLDLTMMSSLIFPVVSRKNDQTYGCKKREIDVYFFSFFAAFSHDL